MSFSRWNWHQTTIGHLKVRYSGSDEGADKTALRLRLERLLSNADVQPRGQSTGAVLIVRKLDSPAPLQVSKSSLIVQGNWDELLRRQLVALRATAARPAQGEVALDTSSVFFADPAEILACLTRDVLNGRVGERWYWQHLLHGVKETPAALIATLWCEQAAFVPSVLASLKPVEVYDLINRFEPFAVMQVIRSLHDSFDLPVDALVAIASNRQEHSSLTSAVAMPSPAAQIQSVEVESRGARWTPGPPWQQWLPRASLQALSPERHYLLGLGLTLYHAPALARSARFAVLTVRWLRAEHEKPVRHPEPPSGIGLATEKGEQKTALPARKSSDLQAVPLSSDGVEQEQAQINDRNGSHAQTRWVDLPPGEEQLTPVDKGSYDRLPTGKDSQPSSPFRRLDRYSTEMTTQLVPSPQAEQGHLLAQSQQAEQLPPSQLSPAQHTFPSSSATAPPSQTIQQPLSLTTTSPAMADKVSETEEQAFLFGLSKALPADGVSTRLGGVLYLINLMTWLGLPHSWDDGGVLAELLSGWKIVEYLACGLLGDLYELYVGDPIWQALAMLDGREPGVLLAAGSLSMEEDKSFHLPAAWLKRYGSELWSAFQNDERLWLFDDAAGFMIADVPVRNRTFFEVAHTEVEAYCHQGIEVNWHPGSPQALQQFLSTGLTGMSTWHVTSASLERAIGAYLNGEVLWWLGRVLGFVRYLLASVLREPLDSPAKLAELVLCRHGQLIVSRTHVDLYMSMEEISIAMRRSGLDRDPGWVPDLARIVYFHFD